MHTLDTREPTVESSNGISEAQFHPGTCAGFVVAKPARPAAVRDFAVRKDLGGEIGTQPFIAMARMSLANGETETSEHAENLALVERQNPKGTNVDSRTQGIQVENPFRTMIDASGDPALGLKWGNFVAHGALSLLSRMHVPMLSLRQLLGMVSDYERRMFDTSFCELVERNGTARLRVNELVGWSDPSRWFLSEVIVSAFVRTIRSVEQRCCSGEQISFAYEAPPHRAEYARIFGENVQFRADFTEVAFAGALLDLVKRPVHQSQEMNAGGRSAPSVEQLSYSFQVYEFLLERGPVSAGIATTARAMNTSERTLRRRLAQEGSSYRVIERAALASIAEGMMRDSGLSIQDVASEMGFASTTSFHRAFKRWHGTTPRKLQKLVCL